MVRTANGSNKDDSHNNCDFDKDTDKYNDNDVGKGAWQNLVKKGAQMYIVQEYHLAKQPFIELTTVWNL